MARRITVENWFINATIPTILLSLHPAVRTAAVEACLPILNIDREKAIQWFVQACQNDPRVAACRTSVDFFNCGMQTHQKLLEPLVRGMLSSPFPDVAQEGAKEITARWLFHGYFEEELNSCIEGTVPQRKGVAQVIARFALQPEYTDKCRQLLETLVNDPDSTVRSETRTAFKSRAIFSIPHGLQIVDGYLKTKAYHDDPTPLFYAMEDYPGSLLSHTGLILEICQQFTGPLRDASRDMSTGIAADVHRLLPLLLRLYEQAQECGDKATINSCLDAWDMLFEKRIGTVQELTQSIEQ